VEPSPRCGSERIAPRPWGFLFAVDGLARGRGYYGLMPSAPRHACANRACPNRATMHGYCAACFAKRPKVERPKDERPSPSARGYDEKWRRIRAQFLKAHPHCCECGAPATEADHVVPLAQGGTNKWDNLQPMCKSCHSRKTARHDGGFGNSRGGGG